MAFKDQKRIIEALKTAKTTISTVKSKTAQHRIDFIDQKIAKLHKDLEVMEFARRDCLEKLKAEILRQKTGIDFSDLFD